MKSSSSVCNSSRLNCFEETERLVNPRERKLAVVGLVILFNLICLIPNQGHAANIKWNGSFNNQWGFDFNWDGVGIGGLTRRVPADFDSAELSNTSNGNHVFLNSDTAPINGLSIANGIEMSTEGYVLNVNNGLGTAEINVDGAGTVLFVEDNLNGNNISALFTDNLNVNSGYVEVQSKAEISDSINVNGDLYLAGAFVNAGRVALGNQLFKSGHIRMLGGSRLITKADALDSIGTFGSSVLDVVGTSLAEFGILTVGGVAGDPTINVESGGVLLYTELNLGGSSSSTSSTLNVSGEGSQATHSQFGAVNVGGASGRGEGTVNVSDSGSFTISPLGLNVFHTGKVNLTDVAGVGGEMTVYGNILIDGGSLESSANSLFDLRQGSDITIKNQGSMKLSQSIEFKHNSDLMVDNGTFEVFGNTSMFVIGDGGTSTATIDGPSSSFLVGGFAEVGKNGGDAMLTLSNGATGDFGRLIVDDSGGQFTSSKVFIESAATATTFATVTVAANGFGSDAALTVTGSGSKLSLGANAPVIVGANVLNSTSAITVADSAMLELSAGAGFINVFGNGILTIDDANVLSHGTGGLNNFGLVDLKADGTLSLTAGDFTNYGTVSGSGIALLNGHDFDNTNGVIAPGNSPGELTINASQVFSGADSVIEIELGGSGAGESDKLTVSGTFFAGGTLKIILLDDFFPGLGESFDIISAGLISGSFDAIDCSLCGTREFALNLGPSGFSLEVTAVPLPAALWMLLGPLAMLVRQRSGKSALATE